LINFSSVSYNKIKQETSYTVSLVSPSMQCTVIAWLKRFVILLYARNRYCHTTANTNELSHTISWKVVEFWFLNNRKY